MKKRLISLGIIFGGCYLLTQMVKLSVEIGVLAEASAANKILAFCVWRDYTYEEGTISILEDIFESLKDAENEVATQRRRQKMDPESYPKGIYYIEVRSIISSK